MRGRSLRLAATIAALALEHASCRPPEPPPLETPLSEEREPRRPAPSPAPELGGNPATHARRELVEPAPMRSPPASPYPRECAAAVPVERHGVRTIHRRATIIQPSAELHLPPSWGRAPTMGGSLRECYSEALRSDPCIRGDFTVNAGTSGRHIVGEIVINPPLPPTLHACVQHALRGLTPPAGEPSVAALRLGLIPERCAITTRISTGSGGSGFGGRSAPSPLPSEAWCAAQATGADSRRPAPTRAD